MQDDRQRTVKQQHSFGDGATLNDDSESYNPTLRTRYVAHQEADDSSSDDNFLHHLKTHHTSNSKHQTSKMCTIQINGININAEPDSGSDTNIMDESQFSDLQGKAPEIRLQSTMLKLKALKEALPVTGEAKIDMSNANRRVQTTIIVMRGKIDSPPLIGREILEALGMLLIDETGGLKTPNKNIRNVKHQMPESASATETTELSTILTKFQQRFIGIGKAMCNGKEIQIKIPMKPDATPIAQKA